MGGDGLVEVIATPECNEYPTGVLNTLRVLIDIRPRETEPDDQKARPPLNVCFVLDTSGSMTGSKLDYAKLAIKNCLQLMKDNDVFHLVRYNTQAYVVMENFEVIQARQNPKLIDKIKADGGTNIKSGLVQGHETLKKNFRSGFTNRIFLFSDGLIQCSEPQDAESLGQLVANYLDGGVCTSAFGIGRDYDEKVMKAIAEKGGGDFFYLRATESIQPLVAKALDSAFQTCATKVKLVLRGQNGAIVTKVWGYPDLNNGALLGDLHCRNSLQVLAEMTVPGASVGDIEVLHYELSYCLPKDLNTELKVVGALKLTFKNGVVLCEPNAKVRIAYLIQQSGDIDTEMDILVKTGNTSEAIVQQKKSVALLEEAVKIEGKSGAAASLLNMANILLESLEKRGITQQAYQAYDHQSYLKKKAKAEYIEAYDEDFGLSFV